MTQINHIFKNNLYLIKKIIGYNKALFSVKILYALLSSFITLVSVLLPKYLLDAIISNSPKQIFTTLLVYGVIMLIHGGLSYAYHYFCSYNDEKIYVRAINEFLEKGIQLDLIYFEKPESYDKYNRAFENCCSVIQKSSAILLSIITSLVQLVLLSGVLIAVNGYFLIVILFFVFIKVAFNNYGKKLDYTFKRKISEKNRQVNYLYRLFYIPQFIRELKTNNLSSFIIDKKQKMSDDIISYTRVQSKKAGFLGFVLNIFDTLEYILVALYFGLAVFAKRIIISDYFTCINAYTQLKTSILTVINSYSDLYSNSLFADDYIEFMNCSETRATNQNGYLIQDSEIQIIEFSHVTFRYPHSQSNAIDDISFTIHRGEKIAIIGENGAGKTTIIKLLLRLYDPLMGEISINGRNIKDFQTDSLRKAIQVLFQDFAVYAFTIYENIVLGKGITEEQAQNALSKVGLQDKIDKLPLKLNTPITSQLYSNGIEFSGGETQKLALARVYANQPQWFIMDEPTSNLDPYAEHRFYKEIMSEIDDGNTLIVISHRLTLTYKMSKIIVIYQGKVVENGTHNELIALGGRYMEMYSMQAEKFVDRQPEMTAS